jgi:hypothetical protein
LRRNNHLAEERFFLDFDSRRGALHRFLFGCSLATITAFSAPAAGQNAESTKISIPSLTPVEIEIGRDLSSRTSKAAETFPISLHSPIVLEGNEVVPAGASGIGEVVHVLPAGPQSYSGQLILAARYLRVGERRLRLRSLRFAVSAEHVATNSNGGSVSDRATGVGLDFKRPDRPPKKRPFFDFKFGSNVEVPAGSVMTAKTAEAFELESHKVVEAVQTGGAR